MASNLFFTHINMYNSLRSISPDAFLKHLLCHHGANTPLGLKHGLGPFSVGFPCTHPTPPLPAPAQLNICHIPTPSSAVMAQLFPEPLPPGSGPTQTFSCVCSDTTLPTQSPEPLCPCQLSCPPKKVKVWAP